MSTTILWSDIAVRLACTLLAGTLLGWNRSAHGRAAGLRTTILLALAACLSMLQVNLLLNVAGKPPASFVTLDLMRLPLGILSGIGFIGAGAIVRRDNFVVGVTTAATMWFATVLGLCFGGGQIALGLVSLMVGVLVLTAVKVIEDGMKQDHLGILSCVTDFSGPDEDEIRAILEKANIKISSISFSVSNDVSNRELNCDLRWRANAKETRIPEAIKLLAGRSGVIRIAWKPMAR